MGPRRRPVRGLAGGRAARLGAGSVQCHDDGSEGQVARRADADPRPARAERDHVGRRLQPRPAPNGAQVVAAFTNADVRVRLRPARRHTRRYAGGGREHGGWGSTTMFGFEPNFRAYADGSARLLLHAILQTPSGAVPYRTPTAGPAVNPLSLGSHPCRAPGDRQRRAVVGRAALHRAPLRRRRPRTKQSQILASTLV